MKRYQVLLLFSSPFVIVTQAWNAWNQGRVVWLSRLWDMVFQARLSNHSWFLAGLVTWYGLLGWVHGEHHGFVFIAVLHGVKQQTGRQRDRYEDECIF
ncbi:hypothetical protein B0T09DRAFT_100228 [Sordaria sp. MPI-SDFR-AT-0083]|nr:hypothetical protein B0T09DRAFT_100228 [Sordaria sp. MPI-SDFR-AT-0083]